MSFHPSQWDFLSKPKFIAPPRISIQRHGDWEKKERFEAAAKELFSTGGVYTKTEIRKYILCGQTWANYWTNENCSKVSERPTKWELK